MEDFFQLVPFGLGGLLHIIFALLDDHRKLGLTALVPHQILAD